MMRTGVASLPLHPGKAPRWLFGRMVSLSGAMAEAMVDEYGHGEFLRRLSDPCWFQAFTCVIGFDWHSSGRRPLPREPSRRRLRNGKWALRWLAARGRHQGAPSEIGEISGVFGLSAGKTAGLQHASRMAAKVDSAAVQDGYHLYHHAFVFSEKGDWAVIQQGLNDAESTRGGTTGCPEIYREGASKKASGTETHGAWMEIGESQCDVHALQEQ